MDQMTRKIVVTEKGQYIPIAHPTGMRLQVFVPDDDVIDEIEIDISAAAFEDVQKRAVTNNIDTDILQPKGQA